MAWEWVTTIQKKVTTVVQSPFSFFSALMTPNSGKSSKRFLYMALGWDIIAITWFILWASLKNHKLENDDLIKYLVNSHVWIILGLAGAVTGIALVNAFKGNKPAVPGQTIEEVQTNTTATENNTGESVKPAEE